MELNSEGMRDRLLSRLPRPENLVEYRKEVSALLEKNEKTLRRQKWYAGAIWFWVVGLGVALMLLASMHPEKARAAWLAAWVGSFACFMLISGAVELMKYFINRARVELLKETKQVQLQVLELHDLLRKGGVS
jgi:hypothetical protein